LQTPTKYGKQRSIASVNKEISNLKTMFNIAVREQWLSRSPFDNGASLIGQEEHRNRVLEFSEEKRLFAAIESHPSRSHVLGIVLLGLDCALRRGEIFKLLWSDCNFERRTITVRAFNAKTARKRTVAMTSRVCNELIKRWNQSEQNQDALVFGITDNINTAWKKVCREAGIEDFHFHDTRHSSISRMIRAGLPPVEVMRVSRHATMAAFYRYANLEADSIFRAASALDSFLASANKGELTQNAAEFIN
jgi:integrase